MTGTSWRKILIALMWYAVSVAGVLTFRWAYFGFLFPNTYYAKVDGDLSFNVKEGWAYLESFAKPYAVVAKASLFLVGVSVVAGLVTLVARVFAKARWHPWTCIVWAPLIVAGGSVVLAVGGDHFAWWRFVQPYWIALLVGLLLLGERFLPALIPSLIRGALVCSVVLWVFGKDPCPAGYRWEDLRPPFAPENEFRIAKNGRLIGNDLNRIFASYPSLPTIGALTVGGLGYSYKGPINDLLGLNNVEMAHASTDRKYCIKSHSAFDTKVFLRQRPPFLFFMADYCDIEHGEKLLETHDFYARCVKRVHQTTEFQALYVPVVVWDEVLLQEGRGICGYALREELASGKPLFGFRAL